MHSCPLCGQACDCDGEDTWLEDVVDLEGCDHQCEEFDDEVDDCWPDWYELSPEGDEEDDRLAFGYSSEWGWYPPVGEVEFRATLNDVMQPNGKVQKQWSIVHNLDYYALIFLGENMLGMPPDKITGEMVVKACRAARWDDASVFFATTFGRLVESGGEVEEDEEGGEWNTDEHGWEEGNGDRGLAHTDRVEGGV